MADDSNKKNPLNVLEDLLNDIDGGGGGGAGGAKSTGPTPEEIEAKKQADELEARRLIFEEKQKAQAIIDQQKIEEQKIALEENMHSSAANQARKQQDAEKKQDAEQKQQAQSGYEISQLGHTKI